MDVYWNIRSTKIMTRGSYCAPVMCGKIQRTNKESHDDYFMFFPTAVSNVSLALRVYHWSLFGAFIS